MSTRRTKIVQVIGRLLLFCCVLLLCTMVPIELFGAGAFEQFFTKPWNFLERERVLYIFVHFRCNVYSCMRIA